MRHSLDRASAFYNPNHEPGDINEQIRRVLQLRAQIDEQEDDANLYAHETKMYQELILLDVDQPDTYITDDWHLSEEAKTEIEKRTLAETNFRIRTILRGIVEVQSTTPQGVDVPTDLEAAGMVCAYWAHYGRERLNGGPYYNHPASVAEILRYAWQHNPDSQRYATLEQYRLDRLVFLSMVHDTFEDDQMKDGRSFLDQESEFRVTPLVVRRLFEMLGRDDGDTAADSLLRLTKIKQITGSQSLDEYRAQFADDPDSILIKLADNRHNGALDERGRRDVDPNKTSRNAERLYNYRVDQTELMIHLGRYALFDQWVGHAIMAIDEPAFRKLRRTSLTIRHPHIPAHGDM